MATTLSKVGGVSGLLDRYESLKRRHSHKLEKARDATEKSLHSAVSIASAFGVGMLRSRQGKGPRGEVNFPGTDIDAEPVVALGLFALGATGYAGKSSDLALAAGTGVACAYAAFEGKRIGDASK